MATEPAGIDDARAVQMHGKWTVVLPAVDLDPLTSPILGTQLEGLFSAGIHPVAVDWREVTFFDSSAISVLLQAHREFTEADRRFAVIRRVGSRSRLFEIMGLDQILTLVDCIDELD